MYRNILVPVDLSDKHSWRKALPTAVSLCETFEGRLHLMTVVPEFGLPMVGQFFPEGYEAKLRQHAAKQLKEFAAAQVPDEIELPPHRRRGQDLPGNPQGRRRDQGRPDHHGQPPPRAQRLPARPQRRQGHAPRQMLGHGGAGVSAAPSCLTGATAPDPAGSEMLSH